MSYDYKQEQYLRELWIAEGITSYFDDLFLVWAGLCNRDEYLCRLSKNIQAVQTAPGRLVQGLVDASWDTWVKHYRPDENSQNSRISYYLKGAVLAWILDAEMRRVSDDRHALASVMKQLWQEFRHTGYTICDFERLVELRCGTDLREWLHTQVREPQEFDFASTLRHFGLRFKASNGKKEGVCDKPTCDVWIGSDSSASDGRLIVRRVYRGSPSDIAGLNVDDELVALDRYRLTSDSWPDRLGLYQPGQELELLVSRRGRIKQLTLHLGRKPPHNWQLEIDPAATTASKRNLNEWLCPAPTAGVTRQSVPAQHSS
jgi:predicted metalloprotease with PDZ domain